MKCTRAFLIGSNTPITLIFSRSFTNKFCTVQRKFACCRRRRRRRRPANSTVCRSRVSISSIRSSVAVLSVMRTKLSRFPVLSISKHSSAYFFSSDFSLDIAFYTRLSRKIHVNFFFFFFLFRNTVRSAPGWLWSRHRLVNFSRGVDRLLVDTHGAKRAYLRRDELPGSDASEFRSRRLLHPHGVAIHLSVYRYVSSRFLVV